MDSALSMVKATVAGEDPAHPLSDAEIVEGLAGHGLVVKRRTVTKCREVLGIVKSNNRRRAAAMQHRSRHVGTSPRGTPPFVQTADRE